VLIDGDEVVSDSRRILGYLDWRYGADQSAAQESGGGPSTINADE
jgi:hypothetical protein